MLFDVKEIYVNLETMNEDSLINIMIMITEIT